MKHNLIQMIKNTLSSAGVFVLMLVVGLLIILMILPHKLFLLAKRKNSKAEIIISEVSANE